MNIKPVSTVASNILTLMIVVFILYGWFNNIVELIKFDLTDVVTLGMLLRVIGIPFFPLGIAMGYV